MKHKTKVTFKGEDFSAKTGFQFYLTQTEQRLKDENPEIAPKAIKKEVQKGWTEMSQEQKVRFKNLADAERERKMNLSRNMRKDRFDYVYLYFRQKEMKLMKEAGIPIANVITKRDPINKKWKALTIEEKN